MMQPGLNSTIGDVTTVVTKGTTPTTMGRSFTSIGIGFIKAECISDDGALIKEKQVFIDEETDQLLKRSRLQRDDVLFSIAGVIGRTALVQEAILPANTNQAIAILRPKGEVIDPRFLYYTVRAKGFQDHSLGHVVQTAQANVSLGVLSAAPIWLPSLPVQRRIAGILSAYDGLMENSQRRIRLLEAMARALYREWFVHFRFPGHAKHPRVASSLGDIPQGWEVTTLGNVVSMITKGTTPTTLGRQYQTEGFNFIKAESIEDSGALLESKFAKIDLETHELLRRSQLCANDILFSIAGVIGRVSIVPNRVLPANTNQALAVIRCSTLFLVPYLYMTLRDEQFRNYSFGRIVQTAQANVSLTDLRTAPLVLPPSGLLSKFNAFTEPLMAHIQALSEQIQNLRRTRDLLLPRLLSGQLEIGNN